MSEHQRISILSNELIRRFSNVHQVVIKEEITGIIEHYIVQLKTSGYDRKQIREIITSGVIGSMRKVERRKREGLDFYKCQVHNLQEDQEKTPRKCDMV